MDIQFPKKFELRRSIEIDGKEVGELMFDEPTVGDTLKIDEESSEGRQLALMVAGMAGLAIDDALKIRDRDFARILKGIVEPYQKLVEQDAKVEAEAAGNVPA